MLNLLFKFVFNLITKVADILLSPLIAGITALIPNLSSMIDTVYLFASGFIDFIPIALDIMLVPRVAFIGLLDYFFVKYSIYLVRKTFNFTLKIYQKFKP